MSRHPAGRTLPAKGTPAGPAGGRQAVPGHRAGAPGGPVRHGRNGKAQQAGGTSGGKLALLAAFVIFAVCILPYLGR